MKRFDAFKALGALAASPLVLTRFDAEHPQTPPPQLAEYGIQIDPEHTVVIIKDCTFVRDGRELHVNASLSSSGQPLLKVT